MSTVLADKAPRKPKNALTSAPSPAPSHDDLAFSGDVSGWLEEKVRREVSGKALVRGGLYGHLWQVYGHVRRNRGRGSHTALTIIAAIADQIAKGRRVDLFCSRARLYKALKRSLVKFGPLPGQQAWREGLRVVAGFSRFLRLRGHSVCLAFGLSALADPQDPRLGELDAVAENAASRPDSEDHAAARSLDLAVQGPYIDRAGRSQKRAALHGPCKERARATLGPGCGSFSEWVRACCTTVWGRRAAELWLRRDRVLVGTPRDVARALLEGSVREPWRHPLVVADYLAENDQESPLWPPYLARDTVLRGLERALLRLVEAGLIVRDGDRWSLPSWKERESLTSRGLQEQPSTEYASPRMAAWLKRSGVEKPETLSKPESVALNRRLWTEHQAEIEAEEAKEATRQSPPSGPVHERGVKPSPHHCQAVHEAVQESIARGQGRWRRADLDALQAVLEDHATITESHGFTLKTGGDRWAWWFEKCEGARHFIPYLTAVIRQAVEETRAEERRWSGGGETAKGSGRSAEPEGRTVVPIAARPTTFAEAWAAATHRAADVVDLPEPPMLRATRAKDSSGVSGDREVG